MCKNLVCFVLMLALASASYGVQLAMWDTGMDGWKLASDWGGTATLTPGATVGVTQGTGSLKADDGAGATGWHWQQMFATWDSGLLFTAADIQANNMIEFDVTRLVSDWGAGNQWSVVTEINLQLQYEGDIWQTVQYENLGNWDGTDNVTHVVVDYTAQKLALPIWNVQMAMGTNSWGSAPTNAITYWDNVKATPEPTTIVLLGMGGLALLRKKR